MLVKDGAGVAWYKLKDNRHIYHLYKIEIDRAEFVFTCFFAGGGYEFEVLNLKLLQMIVGNLGWSAILVWRP